MNNGDFVNISVAVFTGVFVIVCLYVSGVFNIKLDRRILRIFAYCIGIVAAIATFSGGIYFLYGDAIFQSLTMFMWSVIFTINTFKNNFRLKGN